MSDEVPHYNGECKHFHQEPYYTPNNYDLSFDPNSIPSNIPVELANTLQNRLQKLMPLSKIIHLDLGKNQFDQENLVMIHTTLTMNKHEVKLK
jgi:hypothetical protein